MKKSAIHWLVGIGQALAAYPCLVWKVATTYLEHCVEDALERAVEQVSEDAQQINAMWSVPALSGFASATALNRLELDTAPTYTPLLTDDGLPDGDECSEGGKITDAPPSLVSPPQDGWRKLIVREYQ